MAIPDRNDKGPKPLYTKPVLATRRSPNTSWFVAIIVALALLAIGYLVFSAKNDMSTTKTSSVAGPQTELLLVG